MKTIIATALAALLAYPAVAAPNCASVADVTDILTNKYGEEVVSHGLNNRGMIVMMWANIDTGSWTATVSDGIEMCIVSQGDRFERVSLRPNV